MSQKYEISSTDLKKCVFFWPTQCCKFFSWLGKKGRTNWERVYLKIGVLSMGMEGRGELWKK